MRILAFISLSLLAGQPQLLEHGRQAMAAGDYMEAINLYQQAVSHYGSMRGELYFNIAQAYLFLDQQDSAMVYYQKSLRRLPAVTTADVHNNTGCYLTVQGKYPEALAAFKKALTLDPEHFSARYNYELLLNKFRVTPPPPPDQNEDSGQEDSQQQRSPSERERNLQRLLHKWLPPSGNDEFNAPLVRDDSLTMEEALRLLDAMRQNELQYLQQLKKGAIKPVDRDKKPAW